MLMRTAACVCLMLVLVCVPVGAGAAGPGAATFDEPARENTVKKDSQSSFNSDGNQQQPEQHQQQQQQQQHQQQQEHHHQMQQQSQVHSEDTVLKQAADLREDFRVSDSHRQEQLHEDQQENNDHPHSGLPLGRIAQDKARAHSEDTAASQTGRQLDQPAQDAARAHSEDTQPSHTGRQLDQPVPESHHSEELDPGEASDDKSTSDEGSRTEAPHTDHMPLGKAPVSDENQQPQQIQLQQPQSQAQFQQPEDPLAQQQSGDPPQQQQSGDPPQQQQAPPGVTVDHANERGQDESSAGSARGGSSFEFMPEEAEQVPTEEEIEGERLFQAGEKLINATYYKEYKQAYMNFLRAAEMNHSKAKEYLAIGYLFGDYLPQNVTRATELFNELADRGSPKAQMGLAFMYSAGFNYNSSQAKALIFLTFSALGGDPMAQMALGYRYYAGIGVESKCETALTYYRKVAAKVAESVTLAGGQVVQRIRLQEEVESQGSNNGPLLDDDLLQYYHFLADKGDQQAQVVLGTLYYQGGKGVQINHEQAYHYFSTAAQAGSGHALGYLGKMHSEGSPVVTQNNHTALEYFKKSADKNNHIGQTGLGMMYLNGLGVEKDTSKAFRYFSLASDQGSVDAQLQLGIMYFTGNGVRKDYKMAVKYFTMSSQNGHVLAFYNLAQMHATGTGVLRNCHTAVELFKNVAERGRWSEMLMDAHRMYHEGSVDTALVKYMFLAELGYEVAQSNVAYMMDSGVSSKFSQHETYQRALLQYSRAASQGSTSARLKMGDYHYYGLGTDVDYESAAIHYRLASEQQHNAQAMFNLGYMHEKGLGLKQDVHLAKRFYDMAAETSLDAHVPVTLALFKLGVFYGMDVFSKEFEGVSSIVGLLDPAAYMGPEWDLYLASVLAVLFGVVYLLRRMR